MMSIRDVERRPAVTCRPDTPLAEAATIMKTHNVGCLVVLDERDHVVGIVTDRDIVVRGIAEGIGPATPIRDVMTHDVCYTFDMADVSTAATEMAARAIRRLPVLDPQGHLTGVVSFDDLIVAYSEEIDRLARAVRKEIMSAPVP